MKRSWSRVVFLVLTCMSSSIAGSAGEQSKAPFHSHGTAEDGAGGVQSGRISALEREIGLLREMVVRQAQELEAQQGMLSEQQRVMQRLAAALETASEMQKVGGNLGRETTDAMLAAGSGTQSEPLAGSDNEAQSPETLAAQVGSMQKDLADTKESLEDRIRAIGPFQFSGDLRVRYEPFFGGGPENAPAPADRHRERLRLRLNANARLNDEFSGGFSLASGDSGDPISTNQTLTGFFTRKALLIDRAFVQYRPAGFKPLRITAGKFAYTWYRTELTWDNDLNPEGVSETLSWEWENRVLQRLSLVAFQLNVHEVSAGRDSAVFGEQLQTNWKFHNRVRFAAHMGFYNFRRPDAIAANQGPGGGATGSSGAFGGSNISNSSGLLGGTRNYASGFGVLDAIVRLDLDTGIPRFPLMVQVDFAQNTRACQNLDRFAGTGTTPPVCDASDRHAYWSEVQFGRTQERGDMRFGYTFIRIERDAVVSAFNFSDLRQATNVVSHRLEYAYQLNSNITLGLTGLLGRQLATASSPIPERWLKRFQFDMIYKF